MNEPKPVAIAKGNYRHNKTGHIYEVLGIALHTETNEQLVVYRQLYKNPDKKYQYELFARPYEMFTELIELNGEQKQRFEKVETE